MNAPTSGPAPSPVPPLSLPACALAKSCPGTLEGRLLLSRLPWPSDSSQQSGVSCSPFINPRGRRPLFWIPGLSSQPRRSRRPHSSPAPLHMSVDRRLMASQKSRPHYLGSKGQSQCSDSGGQENGEFQCHLSLAADCAAEFGFVTTPGRMPQEAWAASSGLTATPAPNRHRKVQALDLMLTRVFLSLTLKLIRSNSLHPRVSLQPPSSFLLTPWALLSGPFVNETRHFSISPLSLIQVLMSTTLPSRRLGLETQLLPRGGCGRKEAAGSLSLLGVSGSQWGSMILWELATHPSVLGAKKRGRCPPGEAVLLIHSLPPSLPHSFNQHHLPEEHLPKEVKTQCGGRSGSRD